MLGPSKHLRHPWLLLGCIVGVWTALVGAVILLGALFGVDAP